MDEAHDDSANEGASDQGDVAVDELDLCDYRYQ